MTAIVAPQRSLEQRMEALQKANDVRVARKHLKLDLKAGRADLFDLVAAMPPHLDSMRVHELLSAPRGRGRGKTDKAMDAAHITPSRTLGSLTDRQRLALLVCIDPVRARTLTAEASIQTYPRFPRRLRSSRRSMGWTQRELAEQLFYASHVSVSHWENGARFPSEATVLRLAEVLGVSREWLLGVTDA